MADQPVTEEDVRQALLERFDKVVHLDVKDVTCGGGCGAKFDIVVVSDAFQGVTLLNRQRQVNSALGALMPRIHAISVKALTEEQWQKQSAP